MNQKLESVLVLGFMIVLAAVGGWGYINAIQNNMDAYASSLEKQNKTLQMELIQKDLDYLNREECKHIMMRVMNLENEVKDVEFVCFQKSMDDQPYITVIVDGKQKNYAYETIMGNTLTVECGDDFAW